MKQELNWKVNPFSELTIDSLYKILHLRCEVFIVEQDTPYLDTDYKDQKAIHVQGYIDDKLVAYCRLFSAGDYFTEASIGRVIVAKDYRKYSYGHDLMRQALKLCSSELGEETILISAQAHLEQFYASHGFTKASDPYLEDGIPHIRMRREQ